MLMSPGNVNDETAATVRPKREKWLYNSLTGGLTGTWPWVLCEHLVRGTLSSSPHKENHNQMSFIRFRSS